MHARRSAIWALRGTVLSVLVAALFGVGPVGAGIGATGVEEATPAADSFRVQLYATTDRGAAESFREEVRRWWGRVQGEAPSSVFGSPPPIVIEHAAPYYRVHLGAFASEGQAGRARDFARRQYADAFVVTKPALASQPAPPSTAPTDEPSPTDPFPSRAVSSQTAYRVQLYATTDRAEAESFRDEARRWWERVQEEAPGGVFGANPPLTVEQGGDYHRVRMGAFSTRSEARQARNFLNRQYPEAFIAEGRVGSSPEANETQAEASTQTANRDEPPPLQNQMDARERYVSDTLPTSTEAIWGRIRETVRMVETLSQDSIYTRRDLANLFDVGCSPILPEEARSEALAVEATHYNRRLGLDFEARYGQRAPTAVNGTNATGGLSGTYVGLDWSLLSQGLIGNRQRSNLLEAEAEAERLTAEIARIQRRETCRARRVQERLRGMVPRLLETRIELARYQKQLLRQAYLEGEALLDTYLEVEKDLREAERRLSILQESIHDEEEPPGLPSFPPLINFDFPALAQANLGDSLRQRLGDVERRAIRLEDESAFDTRLSVFSRYSTTRTLSNRDLEFGVRFSQPIFGKLFGNDGRAEDERTELRRREEQLALEEQRANLRTVHRRFEEDQSIAIRAHYRVTSRRERVRQRLSARSVRANDRLNEALQEAGSLIAAMIEKALAYGEVYEEVARAFDAAREPFTPRYLDIHPVSQYEWRGRVGKRSLYIWSDAFRARSNDFIIELARARKIERLIVSAGHNTPMDKVRALQAQAHENDIATELLLASNHWVEPGGTERARTRIANLDLQGSALHLDVEPHMYDDFDQREDEYLRRYLEVLRVARRTIGEDSELVVSVPLFWPDRVYQEIAKIVDRVHLMAYGEKETRQRASQTLEVARYFAPEQRVVALRPEDFSNPWKLDQAISTLQKVVQADRFALHDLDSFLQFIRDEP